jgi:hypothetical protein
MPETQDCPADAVLPDKDRPRDEQTARDREIAALERISHQLALLCSSMSKRAGLTVSSGEHDKRASQASVGAWENEGGGLKPNRDLPIGMTASLVTHYRVGAYSYSDFNHAMAELQRQRAGAVPDHAKDN